MKYANGTQSFYKIKTEYSDCIRLLRRFVIQYSTICETSSIGRFSKRNTTGTSLEISNENETFLRKKVCFTFCKFNLHIIYKSVVIFLFYFFNHFERISLRLVDYVMSICQSIMH